MASVILKDVRKQYGSNTPVITGVNLDILEHEFMVLVGPSGCGKSTLLRMVAGLEEITSGTIEIGGRVVNDVPPKDRDIAMVFQSYALYPHMSVRQNLEFGLKIRGVARPEIDRLVSDAAKILEIEEYLERRPKELSGGQRQRVALGRAIVRKPSVFLFDEPLSNLDAKLRVQMRAEIKQLQHRLQVTSIYVTHDQVEAMTMGHRIAILNAGILQQVGTPLEVYERPANLFVANFIGTPPMNFVEATVTEGGKLLNARTFALPAPAAAQAALASRAGKTVSVGIRPENIVEATRQTSGPTAPLTLGVELMETLGNEIVVHGKTGSDLISFKMDPHRSPSIGDKVQALVELDRLHLFDADTEKRIAT
jgi:multiple sugar transport system ATP-binding protein